MGAFASSEFSSIFHTNELTGLITCGKRFADVAFCKILLAFKENKLAADFDMLFRFPLS